MGVLRVKPSVRFDVIAPGGFRLLAALDAAAKARPYDLTITCGSDSHPAADPHSRGEAYDVRTHDLPSEDAKAQLLHDILAGMDDGPIEINPSPGLNTPHFFGWLEHPHNPDEHIHVQVRRGVTWPPDNGVRQA